MPRGLCAPRALTAYVLPTTSYSCALSAFGAKTASGINPCRIGRFSRGPVPNASKQQFGSANLGSPGPLSDKATQGFQSESCLGAWRCKGRSEEVDRRRRGWSASRKISRLSGRSRAKAKDGSGSHSLLYTSCTSRCTHDYRTLDLEYHAFVINGDFLLKCVQQNAIPQNLVFT